MNRWTTISVFAVTLAAVGCGHPGSDSANAPAPVARDASIALAQQMIDTDTTETSSPWDDGRIGTAPASAPEEAETADV